MNEVRRLARKLHRRAERGPAQPVIDVIRRLVRVERLQVIAHRNALPELLEFDRRQLVAQVRLTDEHDLHQLRLLGLEIREHPQLFERGEAQVLRFVDDEQDHAPREPLIDEVLREVAQQQRLAAARRIEPEVQHDRLEQLARLEHRIDDARHGGVAVQIAEQRLQQGGLARSDLAGDDDEPGVALQAVAQIIERLAMDAARIQVFRVRAQREWTFPQIIETFVHLRGLRPLHGRATRRACPARAR